MLKFKHLIEEWKDIPGFEGYYQGSSFGRIRSVDRIINNNRGSTTRLCGNIMKQHRAKKCNTDGYRMVVCLTKNSKHKRCLVSRLIYSAFYGPIPKGMQVNHIDENTENDSIWNLNLMTPSENINWGTRNKRVATKISKPVYQYSLDGNLIKVWKSARQIEKELGYKHQSIGQCCKKAARYNTAYGYIWRYSII